MGETKTPLALAIETLAQSADANNWTCVGFVCSDHDCAEEPEKCNDVMWIGPGDEGNELANHTLEQLAAADENPPASGVAGDGLCVCGHGKNDHAQAVDGDGKELPEREWCRCCGCDLYNPILPWPDAEGWWWSEIKQRVVECTTNRAELCLMNCGQMWWQDEWQKINEGDRFCRAPNPFKKGGSDE